MNPSDRTAAVRKLMIAMDAFGEQHLHDQVSARMAPGPRSDVARYPHCQLAIDFYAKAAARLFGGSAGLWSGPAQEAILPVTRERIALAVLDELVAETERQAEAEKAKSRFNRGPRR